MRKILGSTAAVLLLAACGSEQDGTFETEDGAGGIYSVDSDGEGATVNYTGSEGEEVNVTSGPGAQVNLPAGYSLYPGAEVVTSTDVTRGEESGALVIMTTQDSPQDVVEFYRGQAEAAGIEIETERNSGGAIMIGGESDSGGSFSINASANGGSTTAHLQVRQSPS